MIVTFVTYQEPKISFVNYDTISNTNYNNYRFRQNCTFTDISSTIIDEPRFVHHCYLKNLNPDTIYYFNTIVNYTFIDLNSTTTQSLFQSERKFKTLHNTLSDVFFLSTGDLGANDIALNLMKSAALLSPSFFVIGGDIGYTNGFPSCYRRWDWVFKNYDQIMVTPSGLTIPLLTCIGNHEAMDYKFGNQKWEALMYYYLFKYSNLTGFDQKLYHIHKLGSHGSIVALDSGIVESYTDQVSYLEKTWSSSVYSARSKITLYHVPIYPSARPVTDSNVKNVRKYFEPLINKYNSRLGLENHDHRLKRTFIMKNGSISNDGTGTMYIGDGSFGVSRDAPSESIPFYMNMVKDEYAIWAITLNVNLISGYAFNENGVIVDKWNITSL
jgi:hypothetical protein